MGCGNSKQTTSPTSDSSGEPNSNKKRITRRPSLTPADQALGETGKYSISEDVIGKGGFAVVRFGTHLKSGANLAIKTVRYVELEEDESIWYSYVCLKQEAHILSLLTHENIAKFIDFIEVENVKERAHSRYLIMEYLKGKELCSSLEKKESYFEGETQEWATDILNALKYMHGQGIVHRDIKLDNLILQDEGNSVKVIDFGFATQIPQGNQGGKLYSFLGTVGYEAPEIVKRRPYDGKAYDMWSFGVVLYILLCGRHPFDRGEDEVVVNERIINNEWSFSPQAEAYLPYSARDLVKKLLVLAPQERLTADQALEHEWFAAPAVSVPTLDPLLMASTDEWGTEGPAEMSPMLRKNTSQFSSGGVGERADERISSQRAASSRISGSRVSGRSFKPMLDEFHQFSSVKRMRSANHIKSASTRFVAAQKEAIVQDGTSAADWGTKVANESIKRVGSYGPLISGGSAKLSSAGSSAKGRAELIPECSGDNDLDHSDGDKTELSAPSEPAPNGA